MRIKLICSLFLGFCAVSAGAQETSAGRDLFVQNCQSCHGPEGKGDGPAGAALDPAPRDLTRRPYKFGCGPGPVFRTITHGLEGTAMPGFGQSLTESERRQIADYVFQLGRQGGCTCGGK
ncbi:cytochrome c [bacterium]|nr:cytochrome c [bacterium]